MDFPIKNGDVPVRYVELPGRVNHLKLPFFITIQPPFSYGFPMVFPLKPPFSYGFPMVFPLKPPFSYGFPMVFPLKPPFSYGFPMVFPLKPPFSGGKKIPWGTTVLPVPNCRCRTSESGCGETPKSEGWTWTGYRKPIGFLPLNIHNI